MPLLVEIKKLVEGNYVFCFSLVAEAMGPGL